jgi:hypothetical protein
MGAILSALGIGDTNLSDTNTSTTSSMLQNLLSNTSNTGTSTTAQNLTPYQQAVEGPMSSMILNLLSNPNQTVAPFQQAAANNINANYNGLSSSLAQQFLSTGGGSSGKFGTALAQGDLQRTGQLASNASTFAQTAAMLPLEGVSLAQNLLGLNLGSTTTGSGTSSSSSTGTTTGSSNTNKTGISVDI